MAIVVNVDVMLAKCHRIVGAGRDHYGKYLHSEKRESESNQDEYVESDLQGTSMSAGRYSGVRGR